MWVDHAERDRMVAPAVHDGGREAEVALGAHDALRVGGAPRLVLRAGPEGLDALVGSGLAHHERTVFGGTFVMSTTEQLQDARRRYEAGQMGRLEPSFARPS